MKRHALVVGIAILGALQMVAPPANASASIKDNLWSDAPVPRATSSTFSGAVTSSSMTYPSSISFVASTSGATSIAGTDTLGLDDSTDAMFTLTATTATPTVNFFTDGTGCATAGTCTARGTITLTFSAPVLNPVLHLTSLSGWAGRWPGGPGNFLATTDASLIRPKWTLINASPAGATIGAPSVGATNLATCVSTGLTANVVNSATVTATGAQTGQVVGASGSANVAIATSPVDLPIATPSAAPAPRPARGGSAAPLAATGGNPALTLGIAILGGLLLGIGIVSLVVQRSRTSRRAQLGDTKPDPSGAGE